MAKILIVEDEKALNEAYKLVLKREGHDIRVAMNGQEALKVFEDYKPDLMLLDLRMPKMGGLEVLEQLDAAKKHPQLKIIVFTNYDNQEEIDKAFKQGATSYILKAWSSPGDLVRVVNTTLKK